MRAAVEFMRHTNGGRTGLGLDGDFEILDTGGRHLVPVSVAHMRGGFEKADAHASGTFLRVHKLWPASMTPGLEATVTSMRSDAVTSLRIRSSGDLCTRRTAAAVAGNNRGGQATEALGIDGTLTTPAGEQYLRAASLRAGAATEARASRHARGL